MYSSKESVNILTSLLVAHGIHHAVVCPGSRNAPIVHNLNECPDIECHPITDERSAGFYALGMAQALDQPVVICVTSGSALLNVVPAVAEAHYQHHSLVVISADRPQAWIGQLDGQTLQQPGALEPWVSCSVTLPEPISHPLQSEGDGGRLHQSDGTGERLWHCNRLVNEALLEAWRDHRPCVHINVPISEPLFQFDVPCLPKERVISRFTAAADYDCLPQQLVEDLTAASRPLVVMGQISPHRFESGDYSGLFGQVLVLHEALTPYGHVSHFDEVLSRFATLAPPDFVLYVGDAVVSKRLKSFLRSNAETCTWRVSATGQVEDTFQNLRGIIKGDAEAVISSLSRKLSRQRLRSTDYRRQWLQLLTKAADHCRTFQPDYSQMAAVKHFEEQVALMAEPPQVHYANSSAIRLANIYANHHVWCNRGVNGIEGTLSTAAGFSLVIPADAPARSHLPFHSFSHPLQSEVGGGRPLTFCVIGDLSFFYDQNALWNARLGGNLRILLLNNGTGGIFTRLPGLEQSSARDEMVAGRHHTSACGICKQNDVEYIAAHNMDDMKRGIDRLLSVNASRPVLLEVFTTAADDQRALDLYYSTLG